MQCSDSIIMTCQQLLFSMSEVVVVVVVVVVYSVFNMRSWGRMASLSLYAIAASGECAMMNGHALQLRDGQAPLYIGIICIY